MRFIVSLIFISASLCAENYSADRSARSFEMKQPEKHRIDTFDFEGEFPDLENIDIDARQKKNVEFYLTGHFPQLETVNYQGAFGRFVGQITGNFPLLSQINLLSYNCAMNLDLRAPWQKSCVINITGGDDDIVIHLPKEIGLIIRTKTAIKGKVLPCPELKKKNKVNILNKRFENELAESSPILLDISIEIKEGRIILL